MGGEGGTSFLGPRREFYGEEQAEGERRAEEGPALSWAGEEEEVGREEDGVERVAVSECWQKGRGGRRESGGSEEEVFSRFLEVFPKLLEVEEQTFRLAFSLLPNLQTKAAHESPLLHRTVTTSSSSSAPPAPSTPSPSFPPAPPSLPTFRSAPPP